MKLSELIAAAGAAYLVEGDIDVMIYDHDSLRYISVENTEVDVAHYAYTKSAPNPNKQIRFFGIQ